MPTTNQNQSPGCMAVFGSVFSIVGIAALWSGLQGMARHEHNAQIGVIVGGIFMIVGLGIVITAMFGLKSARIDQALKAKFPDQPWKWKSQWAAGEIPDDSAATVLSLWAFTVVWNLISFPIAFLAIRDPSNHANNAVYFVLLFPLIGVLVFANAIYATLRRRKFGDSTFVPTAMPFSPGREMVGTILVPKEFPLGSEVNLRIVCVHRVEIRNGKNDRVNETVTWEDESATRPLATRGVAGVQIPVRFTLPADAIQTDHTNRRDQYLWRLTAKASLPGADYSAKFEVPVFANAAGALSATSNDPSHDFNAANELSATDIPAVSSDADFTSGSAKAQATAGTDSVGQPLAPSRDFSDDAIGSPIPATADGHLTRATSARSSDLAMTKPTESGIRATRRIDGGWDFQFAAARNLSFIALVFMFFMVFGGGTIALIYAGVSDSHPSDAFGWIFFVMPLAMAVPFGLLTLGVAVWMGAMLLGKSFVTLSHGTLTNRRTWSPLFQRTRQVTTNDVRDISCKITSTMNEHTYYSITVQPTEGNAFEIASGISSKRDAEWLVDQMKQGLGI